MGPAVPSKFRRLPLGKLGLLAIYVLATVQLVGCYLFLEFPYLNVFRWEYGYERLPFQTRLLLAPLYRWVHNSPFWMNYATHLSYNHYFFPHGVSPEQAFEFYLDIPCLLLAGWVAVRIYSVASQRHALKALVYPVFLVLCYFAYLMHTVQNFAFVYDFPSLAFFSVGIYLIYFRKNPLWFVALFAIATLNRETTLLLLPFYVLAAGMEGGRFLWRKAIRPQVVGIVLPLLAYWIAWHIMIFGVFRHNPSEYYPRIPFNLHCFARLRYYPQLFSACAFTLPFIAVFCRKVRDPQLRVWLWCVPMWIGVMFCWGILVETRVYGELLPLVACWDVLIAEELLAARFQQKRTPADDEEQEFRPQLVRAA
jgi:hypothetical protein